MRQELEVAVCTVVRAGHPGAWDYPWDVYLAAIKELEKAHGDS